MMFVMPACPKPLASPGEAGAGLSSAEPGAGIQEKPGRSGFPPPEKYTRGQVSTRGKDGSLQVRRTREMAAGAGIQERPCRSGFPPPEKYTRGQASTRGNDSSLQVRRPRELAAGKECSSSPRVPSGHPG
jgi:hypothetical protein